MRQVIAVVIMTTASLSIMPTRFALSADNAVLPPTSQPDHTASPQRQLWEARIILYGDESTNEWSLRVRDQDVDKDHQFRLSELWTYDRGKKRWIPIHGRPISATMMPAKEHKDSPDSTGEPDQVLAELPIEKDAMGLFYAKWAVDDVRGSTYFRIGPGLREKDDPILHQTPPEGSIIAVIPIDITHAEAAIIPDPRVVCEIEQ
jgi:hypothetical protein